MSVECLTEKYSHIQASKGKYQIWMEIIKKKKEKKVLKMANRLIHEHIFYYT